MSTSNAISSLAVTEPVATGLSMYFLMIAIDVGGAVVIDFRCTFTPGVEQTNCVRRVHFQYFNIHIQLKNTENDTVNWNGSCYGTH